MFNSYYTICNYRIEEAQLDMWDMFKNKVYKPYYRMNERY